MTCTRYAGDDWIFPFFTEDTLGPPTVTTPMVILDNKLWFKANNNYSGLSNKVNWLQSVDINTGVDTGKIDMPDLNGANWSSYDMAVDNNGYIWTNGKTDTGTAFYVLDPFSKSIVTSFETASATAWNGRQIHFDPQNNLMWAIQNSTTLAAISASTYTVSKTIVPTKTGPEAFGGMAIDTKKNEIWFYWAANTILVYSTVSGLLLKTLTGSFTGSTASVSIVYSADRDSMIMYKSGSGHEIWSTNTYTKTDSFTQADAGFHFPLNRYTAKCDRLAGIGKGGNNNIGWPATTSFETPHTVTVLDVPSTFPTGTYAQDVLAVDDQGSIYVKLYDDTNYLFWIVKFAFGFYNSLVDGDSGIFTDIPDIFNRELIFDLDLGAFYINDIGHTGYPAPVDYVQLPGFATSTQNETIMAGNNVVLVTSGDTVVIDGLITIDRNTEPREENFKYVILSGTNFTLGEYKDFSFKDFVSFDGAGKFFDSYIVTGYDISQDMMRKKRNIYLLVYNERTETIYTLDASGDVVLARQSGCIIQSQWEWNNSAAQGKWGRSFQAYRLLRNLPTSPSSGDELDYGERVILTKNKLRGSGRALSILFRSEDGKDMKLLGWAIDVTRQDFV